MKIIPSNNNNNNNSDKTFNDYINLIKLNIVPILLISFIGLFIAVIYAINSTDIYKSTTTLKITKPQGSILDSPIIPEFQDFGSDRFIANEIEVLKSYRLREKVAYNLADSFNASQNKKHFNLILDKSRKEGAYKSLPANEIAVLLEDKVSIEQKRGLDIVDVTVESPSPVEAALIVNCYASAYQNLDLQYNRQLLTTVKDFLAQQKAEKLNQLSNAEETLRNYQESQGIVQLPDQAKALIDQTSDFEAKMNATKIDMSISEKTLKEYKNELAKRDPEINDYIESFATEPYIKNLQMQIADLMTQKDRVSSNNNDKVRKDIMVKDFDAKINDLKDKLNSQLNVYRAGALASSPEEIKELTGKILEEEVKYQALQASYKGLNDIVRIYDQRLNKLPASSIDLARLTREQSSFEKLYSQIEEKFQEAVINELSVPGNVLIIDAGLVESKPAKPNRMLIIFAGLILSVGAGFGFAFVRASLDKSVKTPEDIQNKNISFLGWIPQIEELKKGDKDFEFIIVKKPESRASEAYRVLRTRIKFSLIGQMPLKCILVTSATAQEGKTTTTVNLAGSFALANYKTVVLDLDIRRPRIHSMLNQKRHPGVTDYFFGQAQYEEILRTTEIKNLSFISAGSIPPNPSEILASSQLLNFLEKLKREFDYILIDSPPVVAVTDAEILSQIVDGTILVVNSGFTETDLMEQAIKLLSKDKTSFLGTILNNFEYRSGYNSYYKYYYYYSKPTNGSKSSQVKV